MRSKKSCPCAAFAGYSKSKSLHGLVSRIKEGKEIRNLHAVKPIIFDQLYCARNKIRPETAIGEERKVAGLGVRPTANRQQDFEVSFGLNVSLYRRDDWRSIPMR